MAIPRHLELAGISFRVLTPGAAQPRALVIHDLASNADAHATEVEHRDAIVPDRRGYGGSATPQPYVATTVEEQSEDAARILEALDAPPLTVIGAGFGTLIALDLARRHPGRVTDLELRDPLLPHCIPESWLREVLALARSNGADAAFFADIAALPSWQVTRRELRALAASATVSVSDAAPPHVHDSADALADLLTG